MKVNPAVILIVLLPAASDAAAPANLSPLRHVLDDVCHSYTNLVAAFSKDGKTLVTGGQTGVLKIWEVKTGRLLACKDVENSDIPRMYSVAYSPDGKTVALGTDDAPREVQLWAVEGKAPLRGLKGPKGLILGLVFSPDGKTIAASDADGQVWLWSAEGGKPLRILKCHPSWAGKLAFSPDGEALYVGTGKGDILVWAVRTGEKTRTLSGHEDAIDSLTISGDGALLASASRKGGIKVWDLKTGKVKRSIDRVSSGYRALAVLTPDGTHVIYTDDDTTVSAVRVSDGRVVATARAQRWYVSYPQAFVISPDGKSVAYIADNSRVVIWDVERLLRMGR